MRWFEREPPARERWLRIAVLAVLGWALVATVLAVGPARILGWLGTPFRSEAPASAPAEVVPPVEVYGAPVEVALLPGWNGDRVSQALPALLRSCGCLTSQPADRVLKPVEVGGTAGDWRPVCSALRVLEEAASESDVRAVIERELVAVPLARADLADGGERPGRGSVWFQRIGLFTGYFEPLLYGSRRRSERFSFPLYTQPADLVSVDLGRFRDDLRGRRVAGRVRGRSLEPYDDREAIASGSLAGRGLELIWVDDAVDAFFLHIQGSGRVQLDDGTVFRVGLLQPERLPVPRHRPHPDRLGRAEAGGGVVAVHRCMVAGQSGTGRRSNGDELLLRLLSRDPRGGPGRRSGCRSDAGALAGCGPAARTPRRAGVA